MSGAHAPVAGIRATPGTARSTPRHSTLGDAVLTAADLAALWEKAAR